MTSSKKAHDLLEEARKRFEEEYESSVEFNAFLDGDQPVRVESPRSEVDAYLYTRSRVLFWLDRDAYDDERMAWEDESHRARHLEVLQLVGENGLEAPFQDLLAAVERGRVVPFVGAGMSKPMGMPLWGEALEELLAKLKGIDAAPIRAHIGAGQYLEAAQALVDFNSVQATNFVRTRYRDQAMRLAGPLVLLPRIARGCVITTNFDDAIERTYRAANVEFSGYMHGKQEHIFLTRLVRGDRCLLKLHGDADDPNTHILTEAQYVDGYGAPFDFQKPLPKALRQVFVSQSLLFLGCSLEQDWTLELFQLANDADEYVVPNHFAILPEPEEAQAKVEKETRLLKLNIQPLWYPTNEHEFVERYLQYVVDVTERRVSYNG